MSESNDGTRPPGLGLLVAELARINCALWHEEDKARCDDDLAVARAKRKIDALNQKRNDTIEEIDELVLEWAWDRSTDHG